MESVNCLLKMGRDAILVVCPARQRSGKASVLPVRLAHALAVGAEGSREEPAAPGVRCAGLCWFSFCPEPGLTVLRGTFWSPRRSCPGARSLDRTLTVPDQTSDRHVNNQLPGKRGSVSRGVIPGGQRVGRAPPALSVTVSSSFLKYSDVLCHLHPRSAREFRSPELVRSK